MMRASGECMQPATPRPEDPYHSIINEAVGMMQHATYMGEQAAAGHQLQDIKAACQHSSQATHQPPSPADTEAAAAKDPADPQHTADTPPGAAHAAVVVGISGGKSKHPKHKPSTTLKLSQQAIRCLETYEHKLLLELQAIMEQNAASTASCAAAGAALGAGAAVAAAERALVGRAALLRSGLLSPPDSVRSARAWAQQEFRRQPGSISAVEQLQAQMMSQLEAAEAKLHVHRTAASSAKVKILQLEELVQQLQLKHSTQQEQLASQQHSTDLQEQLQQREVQILQQERALQQQRLELELKEAQLEQAEQQLRELKGQLQQLELDQWRHLSSYSSLEEQDLRKQQEQLLQEREEHAVLEHQLHWKQEQLELQQHHLQQQQEQQEEQLQQIRTEAQQLQQEREQLRQQRLQLEHQQQLLLLQQQAAQQRQHLAQQQQPTVPAQAGPLQQAHQGTNDVPTLPQHPGEEPGLLQQVAQTLSLPLCSPELAADASAAALSAGSRMCSIGSAIKGNNGGAAGGVQPAGTSQGHTAGLAAAGDGEVEGEGCSWCSALPSPTDACERSWRECASSGAVSEEASMVYAGVVPGSVSAAAPPSQGQQQDQQQEPQQQQQEATEEEQEEQMLQQQQRPACVPVLPNLEQVREEHQEWQVIPSPSSLMPADQQQYHASAFTSVLAHLSGGGGGQQDAVLLGEEEQQQQQQQDDLLRVAEYMHALASDNTVLSCEVFHLQQLLVEQRRSASSSCEAVARRLASEALRATWQAQQAELQQELQQAALDAMLSAASRGGSSGSRCASDNGVVGEGSSSGAAAAAAGELSPERITAICSAVRERLSDLLSAHDARMQGLLEQLDQQVEACCADVDEAAGELNLEQELSTFQEVYEGMQQESEASLHLHQQQHGSPVASGSAAAEAAALVDRAGHAAVVGRDRGVVHPYKPFVTSPSGHVSLMPSRRTSAAQQVQGSTPRGAAGSVSSSGSSSSGSSTAGAHAPTGARSGAGSTPAAAAQGLDVQQAGPAAAAAAAAMFRRKSRLGELLLGQGQRQAAGCAGWAAASGGGCAGGAGLGGVGLSGAEGSRVSQLARLLGGDDARSVASSVDACEPGQHQQQQEQQAEEQEEQGVLLGYTGLQPLGQAYTRSRTPTMDVLGEVAERLLGSAALLDQAGAGSGPGSGAGLGAPGGGGALQAAVRALNGGLSSNGAEAGCSAEQQQEQEQLGWGPAEGSPSLRARFGVQRPTQQYPSEGGVGTGGRPAPSPPALMLVRAIQEAAMAAAAANEQMG